MLRLPPFGARPPVPSGSAPAEASGPHNRGMVPRPLPRAAFRRILAPVAALLLLVGAADSMLAGLPASASSVARVPLWGSLTSVSTIRGGRVNLHGGVRQPAGCGRTVVIQRHVAGTWHSIVVSSATRTGYFSVPVPTSTVGQFAFRAVAPARCRMPVAYGNLTGTATSAMVTLLRAPNLADTTPADTTMNGGSLDTTGTWSSPPDPVAVGVAQGQATVRAPAGSAVLITLG